MAGTMDDMVYHCNNQNSIYVLNTNYSDFGTYEDLRRLTANKREMDFRTSSSSSSSSSSGSNNSRNSRTTRSPIEARNLPHKLKTFAAPKMPTPSPPQTTSTAITIATTATATTGGGGGGAMVVPGYANPVVTSMSTTMCSPAATALQKLFNCSSSNGAIDSVSAATAGGICQNVSHRNQQRSRNDTNTNDCPPHCLSGAVAVAVAPINGDMHDGTGAGVGALLGSVAAKKKCTNVKSTLIAKKTKFLKFLEEEKWRNHNETPPNLQQQQQRKQPTTIDAVIASSNEADRRNAASFTTHNANNEDTATTTTASTNNEQQNKLNNWRMNNDNGNKLNNQQQQENQQNHNNKPMMRKSSYELYQEAADILGLSCTLCDNCRCYDCQSGYFDFIDDDSYSEHSLMDEYSDYEYSDYEYGYGYDYENDDGQSTETTRALMLARHHHHVDTDKHSQQQQQHQEYRTSTMDYALNCQHRQPVECTNVCIDVDANPTTTSNTKTIATQFGVTDDDEKAAGDGIAIDLDLINATSSQVLENCETFNDLSLLDTKQQQHLPSRT